MGKEKERDRETDRERKKETDRDRERKKETDRDRQRQRQRQRQREYYLLRPGPEPLTRQGLEIPPGHRDYLIKASSQEASTETRGLNEARTFRNSKGEELV